MLPAVAQALSMEQQLRDAWNKRYGGASKDIFLAQPNKGSGGGIAAPELDARKYTTRRHGALQLG